MKTGITDHALREAARQVRTSMLNSLQAEAPPQHPFSQEFLSSMDVLLQKEEKRRHHAAAFRRCIAALLSIAIGLSLFLGLNPEAQAAAIRWAKKTALGQTVFSFFEDTEPALPEYRLMWLPEGMELVNEISASDCNLLYYADPNNSSRSFTIQCALMDSDAALIISHDKSQYNIQPILINNHSGELYSSTDSSSSNGLVWFDDTAGVSFTIISYLDTDVILHIAEGIELVVSTK